MKKPISQFQRQIHLDFHTSPHIPDVGVDFDAAEFAATLQAAQVNSATVFAKCHHGMCYYPTQTGISHPAIGERDLLGEQIEALHRVGIRAPIYTTIVWEEDAATRFPQWRQLRQDGIFAGSAFATDGVSRNPAPWKWLNFLHPDYQDYFEAHLREILERYGDAVDGLFMDILMMHPDADWSESGVRFREAHHLTARDSATQARFQSEAQAAFTSKFSRIISGIAPDISIFYNSGVHFFADSSVGVARRFDSYTHYEAESLPSGFWGYFHFPRTARLVSHWGKEWLGMTGRFQKQWGDFGGIKPVPALEYECFRTQALGGGNSVGDQLPPRGVLDAGAYKLIGAVFTQCADAEPFYEGSTPCWNIGIVCPNAPGLDEGTTGKSEEGAVQMAEECHYDVAMLDDAADLSNFDLLILPDTVVATEKLETKLREFYGRGGKLLLSFDSVLDSGADQVLDFLPLQLEGSASKYPTFWRTDAAFEPNLSLSDRVFYEQGRNVTGEDLEVLAQRVLPYFQRTDVTYSSHFQTPPIKDADEFPAIVAGQNFVYFADPIFREYRQTGNIAARDGWRAAMKRLVGPAPWGEGLPTTVAVYPRRRGNDLILTLLHYVPVRKALDIDMIEERFSFAGLTLQTPSHVQEVRVWQGSALEKTEGGFALPTVSGRLLLEVPGYFG